jgi:hypothetical protein
MTGLFLVWCSSTTFSAQLTACLRDLARHLKTALLRQKLCVLGYTKTPCIRLLSCSSALPLARQKSVFAYPKQRATVLVGSVLK